MVSDPFAPGASAQAHVNPDTDSTAEALHHTLGRGITQAAAGNHKHSYEDMASQGGGLITSQITPVAGWIDINGLQGLEINKHSGLVTTSFYIQRSSSFIMVAGVLYQYGTLPVGFRPINVDNVGPAIAKLSDVRMGAVGIFQMDGLCGIRVFTSGTLAPVGTYTPDDYIAVNITFRHAG